MQQVLQKSQVVANVRGTLFIELPYFVKCIECHNTTTCVHLGSVNDCEFLCINCWNEKYEDICYRGEWY